VTGCRLALALALSLAFAPAASAATVTGGTPDEDGVASMSIDRAGGEINYLVVAELDDGGIRVTEQGEALLRAAGTCEQRTERRVVCTRRVGSVFVDLGGGADRAIFNLTGSRVLKANGGDEADEIAVNDIGRSSQVQLRGGRGGDTLLGSPRRDKIYGGAGRDTVAGGAGDDILMGDGGRSSAGHDQIWGGGGRDSAGWSDRRVPVTVDLRGAASGGTEGEGDRLVSIEAATGGSAGDLLIGDGGPNVLDGGAGADLLRGHGGDDELDGGAGSDALLADAGDDELNGGADGSFPDGARDRLRCAGGEDTVLKATGDGARNDPMPQSCEQVALPGTTVAVPRLRLGAERVVVEVPCAQPRDEGRVRLVSRGRELGHDDDVSECEIEPREVEVPLTEPLALGPPIRVVIEGRAEDWVGPYHVAYRLIRPGA
jgi:Ca2+-binding RTX toxin-like protein